MLSLLVLPVVIGINISRVSSDWVKISGTDATNKNDMFFQSDLLSGVISDNNFHIDKHSITPSKEWIEYQKQRFETAVKQKDIFVGSTNLKNNAHIAVPVVVSKLPSNNDFLNSLTDDLNHSKSGKSNATTMKSIKPSVSDGTSEYRVEASKAQNTAKMDAQLNIVKVEKNGVRGPSFQGFVQFLKSIQDTLITKTTLSIKDKIKKLADFRDEILINIEERITSFWPRSPKTKRSISDEAGIDFPTAETALMTISFLTFAVFLIKLVLQVIHTIKSKHYNMNTMTMEPVRIAKRSNARSFGETLSDVEMAENILKAVEDVGNNFS